MYARVTSLAGTPESTDGGIEAFRKNVVPFAKDDGKGAILLVDRASGHALAITLWGDEQAMRASAERANSLRAEAASDLGATASPEVSTYEVAVFEV